MMNVKTCSALVFALMTTGLPITSWAAGCGGITNGLIACYPFDGDANDASGNGLNGIVNGATLTTDRFGNDAKAYYFDGKSYINAGNSTKFDVNYHTITAWIKLEAKTPTTGSNSGRGIVGKVKPYTYETISFGVSPENYVGTAFATGNEVNHALQSKSVVENNQWHFVAMTYDGTKVVFYRDGILDISYPRTGTLRTTTSSLAIGRHGADQNQYGDDNFFKGAIDEVRIYNRSLTDDEIKQLYGLSDTSKNCDSKHAKFDPTTGLLTVPAVDAPTLDPITGESTGTLATFSGQFNLLRGVEDFGLVSDSFKVVSVDVATHDSCNGEYIYADGKFSKGGTLHLPFVDVSSVVIIPPNLQMPGPVKTYDVTMKQLALDAMIFHISDYKLLQK